MELEPIIKKLAGHLPQTLSAWFQLTFEKCEMLTVHRTIPGFLYMPPFVKPPPISALLLCLNPLFLWPMQKLSFSFGAICDGLVPLMLFSMPLYRLSSLFPVSWIDAGLCPCSDSLSTTDCIILWSEFCLCGKKDLELVDKVQCCYPDRDMASTESSPILG